MKKQYLVELTAEQRAGLQTLLRKGVAPARKLTHARILLRADEGGSDRAIAAGLDIHPRTVERTRRRFVEGGLPRALHDKPRPGGRPKLADKQEAFLVALACSQPQKGTPAGPWSCSPTDWLSWRWSRRSAMKRCDGR